jgi:hypothetical protein
MKKSKKFTFKTERSTGNFRSFFPDAHYIKYNRKMCGAIDDRKPYKIRLQVIKSDINEDGNKNCDWKWIMLKKEFSSVQEAKDFLNENIDNIMSRYVLHYND